MTHISFSNEIGFDINIWINQLPLKPMEQESVKWQEQRFRRGELSGLHKSAAIEIFRPGGGTFGYGLLGAFFKPSDENVLNVSVPKSIEGEFFNCDYDFLADNIDSVSVQGSEEYYKFILDGIGSLGSQIPQSGFLSFVNIACGEIGSSGRLFSVLGAAIIRLLTAETPPSSFLEAKSLLVLGETST